MARVQQQATQPPTTGPTYATIEEVRPTQGKPPNIGYAPKFVYVHNRKSWAVRSGRIVPDLDMIRIEDGSNHIRWDERAKKHDLNDMRRWLRDTDRTEIPLNVDAPTHPSYLVSPWPGVYVDRFTQTFPDSDVVLEVGDKVAWLESLVTRGVVKPPTRDVLERLKGQKENLLRAMAVRQSSTTQGELKVQIEQEMAQVRADLGVVMEAIRKADPSTTAEPLAASAVEDL